MGYLKERHGMTMLPVIPKEGQCLECGAFHPPEQPHNRDSLRYQYTFYDAHGRWPTWSDAMGHCAADVQKFWRDELERLGIDVCEEPKTCCMNLSVSLEKGE